MNVGSGNIGNKQSVEDRNIRYGWEDCCRVVNGMTLPSWLFEQARETNLGVCTRIKSKVLVRRGRICMQLGLLGPVWSPSVTTSNLL